MASILRVRQADGTVIDVPSIVGPPGKNGADGQSAYQSAISGGYTGTEDDLNRALALMTEFINGGGSAAGAHAASHAADGVDPITPNMIGAAEAAHTHTAADVGAAPKNHTHSATDVGAAPVSHVSDVNAHVSNDERMSWNGKADKPKSVQVILTASGWDSSAKTQTVSVNGVMADETAQFITPTPSSASQAAYYEAGILCTGQAENSLTFTAATLPTSDLTVYVVIQEVTPG